MLRQRNQKYRLSSWGAVWLLLLAQPLPSLAQSPSPTAPAAKTYQGTALLEEEEPYTLGAGDRLAIDIFNIPEYSKEYQVLVDGTLNLPLAGKVSVKGLTLPQAADLITKIYSERQLLTAPIIAVNLVALRPIEVNLIGAVRNPGAYVVEFKTSGEGGIKFPKVTDALQRANGITAAADQRQIKVLRDLGNGQQQTFTVNLWEFLQNGDRRQDITLRDKDTISVPTAVGIDLQDVRQRAQANFSANLGLPINISLVGEVNRPGPYTLSGDGTSGASDQAKLAGLPTVTRAIQRAGGLTAKADIRKVEVRRPLPSGQVQTVEVNLWQLLEQGDLNEDVVLQEGDAIIVPPAQQISDSEIGKIAVASFSPSAITVNVVGEVKSAGNKQLPPNVSLQQAILAAGGFNNVRANESKVSLLRLKPDGTVERRQIEVDFSRGLSEKDNPVLLNNDVVFVERSDFAVVSDALSVVINPLSQVFNLANTINSLFGNSLYTTGSGQ